MPISQLFSLLSSSKDPNLGMLLYYYKNNQGNTETEDNVEEEDSTEMLCVCWKLVVKGGLYLYRIIEPLAMITGVFGIVELSSYKLQNHTKQKALQFSLLLLIIVCVYS